MSAPSARPRGAAARRRVLKPIVFLLSAAPALWLGWHLFRAWRGDFTPLGTDPIEAVQVATGDWTLRFLALTLAVTPLRRLLGWNELVQYRRMLGLFAFFYAMLHFTNYLVVDYFFDWATIAEDILERPWITIGMTSLVLLVPLAVTSTKGWIRRLGGRRWNLLHRLIYLAAIGGTIHFLLAVKRDLREPLVYAAIFASLLGWRLWVWLRKGPRAEVRGAGPAAAPERPRAATG